MKIGIAITTNNPKVTFSSFLPTLENITEINSKAVFLINFQPPWGVNQILEAIRVIEGNGFEVRRTFTGGWDKPIEIMAMREEAALLGEDCDAYLLCDDDFKFSSGTPQQKKSSGMKYLDCINFLEENERCGVITVKGFLGGYQWGEDIKRVWHDMYSTNRGLFLRKIEGFNIAPEETLVIRGGLEESIAVFARLERGYWPAKQMNNPTISYTERVDDESLPLDDFHHPEVIKKNAQAYIQRKYSDPNWDYQKKKIPKGIKKV